MGLFDFAVDMARFLTGMDKVTRGAGQLNIEV
jgi:hypothetical protein